MSFSVRRFLCRLGGDQIFRGYDLPLAIAEDPSVGPDETSAERCAGAPHPGLISLCHSRVAEKANFHIVETVGDEFFGSFARVGDHLSFFVKIAIGIYAEEVIGENAFHHRGVAVGDGFGPLALAFLDVALSSAVLDCCALAAQMAQIKAIAMRNQKSAVLASVATTLAARYFCNVRVFVMAYPSCRERMRSMVCLASAPASAFGGAKVCAFLIVDDN